MTLDLHTRTEKFRQECIKAGSLLYCKRLIDEFFDYWSEPDRAKAPKQRFEKEKTWRLEYRMRYWASRVKEYNPNLSDSQKTIAQKRHAFAVSLEPYLAQYGKDLLNQFFSHYAMAENKPNPEKLRWESFEFWSLETKLKQWKERNETNRF